MASYRAVNGVVSALQGYLTARMPDPLAQGTVNANVRVLSSKDLAKPLAGTFLGIYLHRVMVDSNGRNRYLQPATAGAVPQPELPVNLHVLLVASASGAPTEQDLMAWAMQELASAVTLDVSHVGTADPRWSDVESVQVQAEEMSTEDLYRIWDVFEAKYTLCVPYVIKTIRLLPDPLIEPTPPVKTRVLAVGEATP